MALKKLFKENMRENLETRYRLLFIESGNTWHQERSLELKLK